MCIYYKASGYHISNKHTKNYTKLHHNIVITKIVYIVYDSVIIVKCGYYALKCLNALNFIMYNMYSLIFVIFAFMYLNV